MVHIVLVGGPTGVGKSAFIDALIDSEEKFLRPRSYTTRIRREGESGSEYEFVTPQEFEQLKLSKTFVTVDQIYDNYYAMSYNSISELVNNGRIAIKEIHPRNHGKIKELLPEAISVLILPVDLEDFLSNIDRSRKGLSKERISRINEDREYYSSLNASAYPFDIVLWVKSDTTSEMIKIDFLEKFGNLTSIQQTSVKILERKNKLGYSL